MTVFLGNVVDMLISGTAVVTEPATEFFVYAMLMFLVMLVFILLGETCHIHRNFVQSCSLFSYVLHLQRRARSRRADWRDEFSEER